MISVPFSLTDPVKLKYVSKNRDVVLFPEGLQGRAVFSSEYKHIESAMKQLGLFVPEAEAKNYPHFDKEKRKIYLEDKDFGIAFYELHYRRTMNPDDFQWKLLHAIKNGSSA